MLTEEVLKEAAAEAERFLMSTIPEDGEPHVFSKRFERKMQRLIRRTEHPIRYRVMRVAAAVVLAIATLFGTVMAVSPEARAAVIGWVKGTFAEFYAYSNEALPANNISTDENGSASNLPDESVKYEYRLSVIPEGYRELNVIEKVDGKVYLYINDLGQILQFVYAYGAQAGSLFIETENYIQLTAMVEDVPADIYIANKENKTSVIVWQDSKTNTIFRITAIADQIKLVEFAETVIKTTQD